MDQGHIAGAKALQRGNPRLRGSRAESAIPPCEQQRETFVEPLPDRPLIGWRIASYGDRI